MTLLRPKRSLRNGPLHIDTICPADCIPPQAPTILASKDTTPLALCTVPNVAMNPLLATIEPGTGIKVRDVTIGQRCSLTDNGIAIEQSTDTG
jgi:hypothetical protein